MTTFDKTKLGPSATALGAGATGATMIAAGAKMIVVPPGPEPGYHLTHDPHDLFVGGLLFGVGVAALYATFRAVRMRDIL